jgi:catechol 2,3-dioxygenase-like lactoylglutathione lyase family enzyme
MSNKEMQSQMNAKRSELAPGHIVVHVKDLNKSLKFYRAIGLPEGEREDDIALLELRGGTHVLLIEKNGAYDNLYENSRYGQREAETFDLMIRGKSYKDLDKYRNEIGAAGISADEIPKEVLYGHYYFTLRDPDGNTLTIYTSHEF